MDYPLTRGGGPLFCLPHPPKNVFFSYTDYGSDGFLLRSEQANEGQCRRKFAVLMVRIGETWASSLVGASPACPDPCEM